MATLYKEKVGAAIRSRREDLGLTQRQLADRIGVESQTVSRWERGANLGKESNLDAVAKGLEISVEDLMSGIEPERARATPDVVGILGGQPEWASRLEAKLDELLTIARGDVLGAGASTAESPGVKTSKLDQIFEDPRAVAAKARRGAR